MMVRRVKGRRCQRCDIGEFKENPIAKALSSWLGTHSNSDRHTLALAQAAGVDALGHLLRSLCWTKEQRRVCVFLSVPLPLSLRLLCGSAKQGLCVGSSPKRMHKTTRKKQKGSSSALLKLEAAPFGWKCGTPEISSDQTNQRNTSLWLPSPMPGKGLRFHFTKIAAQQSAASMGDSLHVSTRTHTSLCAAWIPAKRVSLGKSTTLTKCLRSRISAVHLDLSRSASRWTADHFSRTHAKQRSTLEKQQHESTAEC